MKLLIIFSRTVNEEFYNKPMNHWTYSHNCEDTKILNCMARTVELTRKFGHEVEFRYNKWMDNCKISFDDLDKFDKIITDHQWPDMIFYTYQNNDYRNALINVKDKIISIFNDPADMQYRKRFLETNYYAKRLRIRFPDSFKSDQEVTNWDHFMKYILKKRPIIIASHYNHPEAKADNIYTINYREWFDKPTNVIPFEDKKNKVAVCIGSYFRPPKITKLKEFGLRKDDIEMLGMTFKDFRHKKDKRNEFLSEHDVMEEYGKYRFIFAPTYNVDAYTWFRTRFLYSAMNKCILLGTNPEIKFYGEPYQLDASVLTKSLEEQKEIAEAQSEYFFAHCMTNEESESNLIEALNK